MTRAVVVVALTLACTASRGAHVAAVRGVADGRDAVPPDTRPAGWTTMPMSPLAGTIRDIGALDGGEAVLLSDDALHLCRASGALTRVCPAHHIAGLMVQAEGDRFVVLGGEESAPVLLRSDDRGVTCEEVRAPSMALRDEAVGRLGLSLHGAVAHLWSTAGSIGRSDDGGHSWRRVPGLRGVVEVAPGSAGVTLAAAVIGASGARQRVELYTLAAGARDWRPVSGAENLVAPVALSPREDGTTLVGDAVSVTRLAAEATRGEVVRRVDPAGMYTWRAFDIVAPTGEGSFVASSRGTLYRVSAEAIEARHAIVGGAPLRAIDGARDGVWWATDGRTAWRFRDGDETLALQPPLRGESPVALAARGERVLVVGAGRAVATRDGDTAPWRRLTLPEGVGRPRAAHIDERGALYVLGPGGIAIADADAFTLIRVASTAMTDDARFETFGERWLLTAAAAYTSDDHGARWALRLGPGREVTAIERAPSRELTSASRLVGTARVGAAMLAMDGLRTLWRSDDLGASWERLGTSPGSNERVSLAPSVLAWDGGRRVAVFSAGEAEVSADGGVTFRTTVAPFVVRDAAFVDGALVALGGVSHLLPSRCRTAPGYALLVDTREGWLADDEACEHRGVAFTRDGDTLWLVDDTSTLHRTSLRDFVRRRAPR